MQYGMINTRRKNEMTALRSYLIRISFSRLLTDIYFIEERRQFPNFLLNNQQDALIIQIYSVINLYTFRASSPPIISFLLYVRHW